LIDLIPIQSKLELLADNKPCGSMFVNQWRHEFMSEQTLIRVIYNLKKNIPQANAMNLYQIVSSSGWAA
jgi:hypothetical protein